MNYYRNTKDLNHSDSGFQAPGTGEGDTPYNDIEGEAPPAHFEGTFFKPKVYERVGISLTEVNKKVGKPVLPLVKNPSKVDGRFSGKVEKISWFCDFLI